MFKGHMSFKLLPRDTVSEKGHVSHSPIRFLRAVLGPGCRKQISDQREETASCALCIFVVCSFCKVRLIIGNRLQQQHQRNVIRLTLLSKSVFSFGITAVEL